MNRDINAAARDVQAAINAARGYLPPNLPSNPTYRKVNPADSPIIILALTSERIAYRSLGRGLGCVAIAEAMIEANWPITDAVAHLPGQSPDTCQLKRRLIRSAHFNSTPQSVIRRAFARLSHGD